MTSSLPTITTPEVPVPSGPQTTPVNFVWRGACEGTNIVSKMAGVYAVLIGLGMPLWEGGIASFNLQVALFLIVLALIFGIIPALLVGAMGGAIVGMLFRQLEHRLTLTAACAIGFAGGTVVLLPLTVVVVGLLFGFTLSEGDMEPFMWVWGVPCAIALLGFAWVGYKLNLLVSGTNVTVMEVKN